eukprot:scaffold82613_cov33-Tisochrysis_lutea.AAC.4
MAQKCRGPWQSVTETAACEGCVEAGMCHMSGVAWSNDSVVRSAKVRSDRACARISPLSSDHQASRVSWCSREEARSFTDRAETTPPTRTYTEKVRMKGLDREIVRRLLEPSCIQPKHATPECVVRWSSRLRARALHAFL